MTLERSNFYVITGCSGGGKSTLIDALRRRGFLCVDEVGRHIVRQQLRIGGDATPWQDQVKFRELLLARYLEAARKLPEADQAIGKALSLDDKSIVYRGASARIAESSGNLQGAADAYRQLAGIDRRFKTEHLTNVAKLETQLGRTEQALQAGRDLLAAAPGNPENYEFFAQLCFQLGKPDEGLEALRLNDPTWLLGALDHVGPELERRLLYPGTPP